MSGKVGGFYLANDLKTENEHLLRPTNDLLNSESREILKVIYKQVESFDEVAKKTLQIMIGRLIAWEVIRLRTMVFEIRAKSESNELDGIHNYLNELNIHSFTPQLKMLEHKHSDGLYNVSFLDDQDHDRGDVSSEVIGVREVYEELKDKIMSSQLLTSLVGMPGIGKTTLATKLFNDPTVVERFDHRVWIRVGKKYQGKDIPRRVLEEVDPDGLRMLPEGDEEAVAEHLKASLKSKRYLIVLDDVWDKFTMHLLLPTYQHSYIKLDQRFLHPESGSRILITSRLQQQDANRDERDPNDVITMRLLNREESWDLFRGKVFSQGLCPPQLKKAGKKISEKCEGLPLTIIAVARLLSQQEEKSNLVYWDEIATKKNHQIFMDAYDEISKVLLPSYTYLPPLLQLCFMFIGLFPQKYEVPRSKLFNLWIIDGFIELNVHISAEYNANECLEELVSNSLVMVYQQCTYSLSYKVKSCSLHSSLWHLSKKKARETKFALILNSRSDSLGDGLEGHHRVSFQSGALFCIKDVHKSVEDNCASTARSLFCFCPYHPYQVPLCFRLKLLRELDAISIRFYEFPMEVLQLVMLTYLSLTSNGMIPASISQLQFLEFLIVDRHQNIKSCKEASYLPMEIWSLQKLKHLQVMGSDLPDPHGASLSNLETLSNVSAHSCTDLVFKGMPNLKNLRIIIKLAPGDDGKPFLRFNTRDTSYLCDLYSLKYVIVNPEIVLPIPFSRFPKGAYLGNLSLSGIGYPWREMRYIASLPNLTVLKLKNYAFRGPTWIVEENKFEHLFSLVIEDTDLVNWKFESGAFGSLKSLIIKQCYKLKRIQAWRFGKYLSTKIEFVDCNPSCAEEMKKVIHPKSSCVVNVHNSWDDRKLKA